MYAAQAEAIDAHALCPCRSPEFTIAIEDSHLRLPNAFSPGGSPGVNDIYRVAHKSLLSFKASIYNRWGNLLYHWEDPNQGWDGKVNGKYVPTGVYFIVVEAKGADGKVYTRSRDINILRSKNN
jgi:gliding motility-associated-like protein